MAGQDGDGERYLVRRGRRWQYRRRVPADLAGLDPRGEVRIRTGQTDHAAAAMVARRLNADLECYWQELSTAAAAGHASTAAAERYAAAIKLARHFGVTYRPASALASEATPLADLLARIETLEARGALRSPAAVEAVLGGAEKPALTLSGLFAAFESLSADRLLGKSPHQVRKWRNPRLRAIGDAITVIGDKALTEITRADALDCKTWWVDRVREEGLDRATANKRLGQIAAMMAAVDEAWRLGLDLPFKGVRLAGAQHTPRTPYEPDLVRSRFLTGAGLGSLNDEARAILMVVAATGMRPSEVAGLTAERIIIDADIPHLQVRPDGRQLKSAHAARDMPLVAAALDVMRHHRAGFPRYRDTPDAFSATANKALGAAGLRPTPDHTVYSLRHTFKDRLIAIEAPQRVQDALMGHAVREMRYGAGPSLAQRAEWIARVWG